MTLKQFLSSCQPYVAVRVFSHDDYIDSGKCCFMLHCPDKPVVGYLDSSVDYFTVVDENLLVVIN